MYGCIGKAFFTKKKQPVPVVVKGRGWEANVKKARDSTYFFHASGPCTTVRIAKSSFSPAQVVENVETAIDSIVKNIPHKWRNIQAIHLKTASSIALPIYTQLPQADPDAPVEEVKQPKKKTGPTKPKAPTPEVESKKKAAGSGTKKRKAPSSSTAGAKSTSVKKIKATVGSSAKSKSVKSKVSGKKASRKTR